MRPHAVWTSLLGVEDAVIEEIVEEDGVVVIRARPRAAPQGRCGTCGRRCPGYDQGEGRRRWRTLDLGLVQAYIEADAPRVRCRRHGIVVAAVPWARAGSRFARAFEDTLAWLTARVDKTTVSTLLRVAWRSVGSILERVVADGRSRKDPLDGVTRIGIDEVSYRRGHRYLTVVVDHDSGRLLFATEGKGYAAAAAFFTQLGEERCGRVEVVSADASSAFVGAARRFCPRAAVCMDPFHVVKWATDAVDMIRRQVWNEARRAGLEGESHVVKGLRFALLKNPEDLTIPQKQALKEVQRVNQPLYRAYLLKEQLREVFRVKGEAGMSLLEAWLAWAVRCRLLAFRRVAAAVKANIEGIRAALVTGISNARVEALNTKMRLITRQAYGFHSHEPLIALAMLKLGGFCPPLPRSVAHGNGR